MDIGNQRRVIIVEPEDINTSEEQPQLGEAPIFETTARSGAWPLPLHVPVETSPTDTAASLQVPG